MTSPPQQGSYPIAAAYGVHLPGACYIVVYTTMPGVNMPVWQAHAAACR